MNRNRLLLLAAVLLTSIVSIEARVISYAPYTDRTAYPAHQSRTNRYFALVEAAPQAFGVPLPAATYGQLVIYDSQGADEPRVVYPADGTYEVFTAVAMRENFVFVNAAKANTNLFISYLSTDGGATWKTLALPQNPIGQLAVTGSDNGGPFASYRYSQIRLGTPQVPFVLSVNGAIYSVAADGAVRKLYEYPVQGSSIAFLAGRNRDGSQFLVRTNSELITVDLNGNVKTVFTSFSSAQPSMEGFIANDGGVYLEERSTVGNGNNGTLWYAKDGTKTKLFSVNWIDFTTPSAFAVPTADYSGAWIVNRGGGRPTVLYRATDGQLEKMWEDITSPDVEAIHAAASGDKLLIQVHRPRPAVDARIFKDPALAVWHIGTGAPRGYDELFLNEQWNKGFVHVDVDKIESGEPFVFDGGAAPTGGGGGGVIVSPPTSGGGGDVVQEWGVVRASLKQQLIFPSVGRARGAFGSDWVSDVIIQNPEDVAQRIDLRFVPSGDTLPAQVATLTLNPLEIRMISDIVGSLFHMDSAIGALFITPESGVTASSRTYSRAANGTFGFAMNAVDLYAAAASPRFPVTFAGAFPGSNFRTNVTLSDTSGHGTEATFVAAGIQGLMGASDVSFRTAANGNQQINFVGSMLGLQPYETGALRITPKHGNAIAAVFAIDNLTNDSTYFPPDIPSTFTARMIPAIGHLDGANGSRFRSDLYLFNPGEQPRTVLLEAKMWDINDSPMFLSLTLLPNEARVIRDVLLTAFGRTGIARLRFTSQSIGPNGVRVTSRTYNVDANGGTYGFLMPPLNNFQIGGSGDTLEILGAFADPNYRTNIGLVEMNGWSNGQNATARVEILDATSKVVDSFTATFPMAGGTQLNDVFRARDLKISGPVLIRITPTSGTIGAYATTTDNGTNDSSYLAANLAAKE